MLASKRIPPILSIIILVAMISPTVQAKSVYVINDTVDSKLQAYEIEGIELVHQKNYTCESDASATMGAVGLAVDSSHYGDFLFVTFEEQNEIELVNAKTMQYVDTVTAGGATNLAGIVVDQGRSKIYVMDRYTDHLYSYSWDASSKTLTPDFPEPYYIQLEDIVTGGYQGAFGIALDEENRRLYVADNTNTIKCYDASDPNWPKLEDYTFTITDTTVGIAVDPNQYVYTGASQFGQSTYLTRYDLSTGMKTRVNVGSRVLGIAVDQETSLIYLTTYQGGTRPDRLLVYANYDPNNPEDPDDTPRCVWSSGDIGNPAGVAVSAGVSYKPSAMIVNKDDGIDPNCVSPGDYISYEIAYDANGFSDPNVKIIDYLRYDVNFVSADPNTGSYNEPNRTYTWQLGTLGPGDSNSVTLTVQVNTLAVPAGTIKNYVELDGDEYCSWDIEERNVCCWTAGTIYVDCFANGHNTGLSWDDAYTDLQDALERAHVGCGSEIWVARGVYKPGTSQGDSFVLADGLVMYGGFAGWENSLDQRNYVQNKTILSGDIDPDGNSDSYEVVKAVDVNETAIVDGFIITDGTTAGVSCDASTVSISNCVIKDNSTGVNSFSGGNLTMSHCVVKKNEKDGIICSTGNVQISNCKIRKNKDDGIDATSSWVSVKNSWVHHNGSESAHEGGYGIYLAQSLADVLVRNNTIVYNHDYGILSSGGYQPDIVNCIIWGNNGQLSGCLATYSCVQDSNDVDPAEPYYTTNQDPNFAYSDPDSYNYHLDPNSPCIDAGDPDFVEDPNEKDIDGDDRIINGNGDEIPEVDMGADECACDDVSRDLDFSGNGVINFEEYAVFADAWMRQPGDPNWDERCDLYADANDIIDELDLDVFTDPDNWLWQACYRQSGSWMMSMGGDGMGGMMSMGGEAMFAQSSTQQLTTEASEPEQSVDIDELVDWLERIWLEEEIRNAFSEQEWQEFIDAVKDSAEAEN